MENNELMVTEELNTEFDAMDYEETGCESGGKKFVAGIAILAGVAAIGGFAYHKCKDKLEERKINKLRKKGYVIFKEDECEVREVEDEDEGFHEEVTE